MPDIPNRDELERKIARLLGKYNRRQLGEILEMMGNHPNMANIPMSYWTESEAKLAQALIPFSEEVYLQAAERMLEVVPIGVDWALINTDASNWARQYGFDLVKGINDTSRQAIGQAVSNFYEQAWTLGDLEQRLGRIYSPVRAEMIARTEVTRASVEGERAVVNEIEKEGIKMVEVWQTRNDEIVCPICGPRHGIQEMKGKGDAYWDKGMGPPAHPRCRCWTIHEFEKKGKEILNPELTQAVMQFEDNIANNKVETMGVFDENGNVLFTKQGTERHILELTDNEKELMRGQVVTHNHPTAGTFSPRDLQVLEDYDLRQMRAVDKDYRHSISFGTGEKKEDLRYYWDKYSDDNYYRKKEFSNFIEWQHNMMMEFAENNNLIYERVTM